MDSSGFNFFKHKNRKGNSPPPRKHNVWMPNNVAGWVHVEELSTVRSKLKTRLVSEVTVEERWKGK